MSSKSRRRRPPPPAAHDECAKDLQTGLNMMGWPDDMPESEPILARGGTVLMPCPVCEFRGRLHTLEIRQVAGHYIVIPTD